MNSNLNKLSSRISDIAIGYFGVQVGAKSKAKASINFSHKKYSITPVILATPETDWTDAINVSIDDTTPTGCTIIAYNSAPSSTIITIHWAAIGISQN